MTILAIRKKLVKYMQVAEDKKIKAVYTILEKELNDEKYTTIEQYNEELAEAEAAFKSGNYITNNAMKRKIKQW